MKKSQFNKFLSEIGASRAPSNIKNALRVSTISNYIDMISRMADEHKTYGFKPDFGATNSLYCNVKKYSYIDPLSSINAFSSEADINRSYFSFSNRRESPIEDFFLGMISSFNLFGDSIYSKNAYSVAISKLDSCISKIDESQISCSRWGGLNDYGRKSICMIYNSMLFNKSSKSDIDLSQIDNYVNGRVIKDSSTYQSGLFEYFMIKILKEGPDYIKHILDKNPSYTSRANIYPAVIISGNLTTSFARRIRSDGSEAASLSGLEALFFLGKNKYDNYNELVSMFTDTNYQECATFLAKNLPINKLAMLIGSRYSTVKHIISERMMEEK